MTMKAMRVENGIVLDVVDLPDTIQTLVGHNDAGEPIYEDLPATVATWLGDTYVAAPEDAAPGMSWDGESLGPIPASSPPTKEELFAHLAERRWQREIAGVTVSIGDEDVLVSTARGDDRAALHMTYSALKNGLRADGATFNFADGKPRKVSNADMEAAVLAALAHVQAAFDLGESVYGEIDVGEITTFDEIAAAFA